MFRHKVNTDREMSKELWLIGDIIKTNDHRQSTTCVKLYRH